MFRPLALAKTVGGWAAMELNNKVILITGPLVQDNPGMLRPSLHGPLIRIHAIAAFVPPCTSRTCGVSCESVLTPRNAQTWHCHM